MSNFPRSDMGRLIALRGGGKSHTELRWVSRVQWQPGAPGGRVRAETQLGWVARVRAGPKLERVEFPAFGGWGFN